MQKTRFGMSVALMGAIIFVAAILGPIPAILTAGYALIAEENPWLKRTAVKALVLVVTFAVISAVISIIPGFISVISSFLNIFKVSFYLTVVNNIVNFLHTAVGFVENVLYLLLAVKALTQSTIRIPMIDNFINKNVG